MTEQEAVDAAEAERAAYGVPEEAVMNDVTLNYIELMPANSAPGDVSYDARAWLVRFDWDDSWIELAIDDQTAKVVRMRRSR